jgi:hypothetical protein
MTPRTFDVDSVVQQARLRRAMDAPLDRSPTLDDSAFGSVDKPPYAPQDVQDVCWAIFAVALALVPLSIAAWFLMDNWPVFVALLGV